MDTTEAAYGAAEGRRRLGPYTLLAPLGAGGMGVVYRARDERLGRDVAIKVVRAGALHDDIARARFRKEALALARLNHSNIASVYDVGVQDGLDYLVMECVPGQTLREYLEARPVPVGEILSIAKQITSALEEAHEQGVVHRDLKPGNIMITPKGHAKILDFGLARLLAPVDSVDITHQQVETGGIAGTPLYMSPEQAEGRQVDGRTDLGSLGVILYESLAGRAPFQGDSGLAVLRSVTRDNPEPLRTVRADVPHEVERIVHRALQKDVTARYQSASEMTRDLSEAMARLTAPAGVPASRTYRLRYAMAIPVVLLVAFGAWFYHRSERRHWAREEATPRIAQLQRDDKPLAAFVLLKEAEQLLPGDRQLASTEAAGNQTISIESTPPGAAVEVQDYLAPEKPWLRLGTTPLRNIRFPIGYFRWKVSKPGMAESISARRANPKMNFDLSAVKRTSAGMCPADGGTWFDMIAFVGWVGPYDLPPYDIDTFEVTNRAYQEFVDAGGYTNPEYWKETFILRGRELKRDEAMALLRDRTGRAGPSTWEGGHYPEGQGDYPVSGVSWYEAAADARYAGKQLPVLGQWYQAAAPQAAPYAVQDSNISRSKLAPVGAFPGLGRYGTYDMIGNVREWVENATVDDFRFILGGAWNSQTYLSVDPEALPPFDRSSANGFRCVRNRAPLPVAAAAPIRTFSRDFSNFKPASDDVFRVFRSMYAYDPSPIDARSEGVVRDTVDFREEKITFAAPYARERVTAYLFLPRKVRPPFQAVVFFPSARVLDIKDSSQLGDTQFFDFIVQSGRAVLYPVYKGTYERQAEVDLPGTRSYQERMLARFKDLSRSIDYLQTRPDIEGSRLAYLGVSMGAAEGVVYSTLLQDELRTAIFLDGGYFLTKPMTGTDQADFAPRLKIPVLMVNGRYDFTFSVAKAQEPLFRMLGTPEPDKRHLVLESAHNVNSRRAELVPAVLGWLDKYLGRPGAAN